LGAPSAVRPVGESGRLDPSAFLLPVLIAAAFLTVMSPALQSAGLIFCPGRMAVSKSVGPSELPDIRGVVVHRALRIVIHVELALMHEDDDAARKRLGAILEGVERVHRADLGLP